LDATCIFYPSIYVDEVILVFSVQASLPGTESTSAYTFFSIVLIFANYCLIYLLCLWLSIEYKELTDAIILLIGSVVNGNIQIHVKECM